MVLLVQRLPQNRSHAVVKHQQTQNRLNFGARPRFSCIKVVQEATQTTQQLAKAVQDTTQTTQQLKDELLASFGTKNGTDRTPEQHEQIKVCLKELTALNPASEPARYPLQGSEWQTVYTDSTGNSSGKLGPLVGRTGQVFSAEKPDAFMNYSVFLEGLLKAELDGQYTPRNDTRIDLLFLNTRFLLFWGLLKLQRDMPAGVKAHWTMQYVDEDLRVLTTNKGSYFVLKRIG